MANTRLNEFNQEIGYAIDDWEGRDAPQKVLLTGEFCEVQPINAEKHALQLFESFKVSGNKIWTYVPIGPYESLENYKEFLDQCAQRNDEIHFAIVDKTTGHAVGTIALISVNPLNGSAEAGYVIYSSKLKRTPIATEAQYLLMKYVFDDLKYRRYEWRCDSLNRPSRTAAERLGFKFEGTFRQVVVIKGRNRDTTWLSIIDKEWTLCKQAFERWLSPDNFQDGVQKRSLSDIRKLCQKESAC
ncbi:hypothetical protein HG536_0G00130 [Torulaspora globosa]|uniref:N-acetyltransferase domain-containing protein n=1 Tax=Torulaspora globosa TaxID=48254 RepID=A0A7G3ZKX1_9SACH|nr:uncharacterized protein HG536_0G00130 [Torulaspora globosa]QLL34157.1 hypothetical protein HG536_0G00130 [Torulaspora globosa]